MRRTILNRALEGFHPLDSLSRRVSDRDASEGLAFASLVGPRQAYGFLSAALRSADRRIPGEKAGDPVL